MMTPLVRRTWAPRGQTPILLQRTRSHDKVSVTAVLTVSPRRRRVSLYAALLVNANVNAERLVEFLRALTRHLRGRLIVHPLANHAAEDAGALALTALGHTRRVA